MSVLPHLSETTRPYMKVNVNLSMDNISIIIIQTAGVSDRIPFDPASSLISLSTLLTKGLNHGTNIALIIISISSVSMNS